MFQHAPDFRNRLFHGLWLALTSVYCALQGGWYFYSLLSLISFVASMEWKLLSSAAALRMYRGLGFAALGAFFYCMMGLKDSESLLKLFSVVWSTDCGAYFAGKFIGGPKLLTKLSPNKTVSGLMGGIVLGSLGGIAVGAEAVPSFCVAMASQFGDLLESYAKRLAQVKDSNLPGLEIPGHGGILDRIDA